MVCGLAAAILFTRALSPEAVGIFNLVILLADLLVLVNNLGLTTSLPKLVASSQESERPALISSTLIFQILLSLLIGAAILGVRFFVREPGAVSNSQGWLSLFPFLWFLPPMLLAANLRDNAMAVLAGLNRYGYRAAGLVVSALLYVGLVFLSLNMLGGNLFSLLAATLVTYLFAAGWFSFRASFMFRRAFDWRTHRQALVFSWPLYANSLLTFAFTRLDTLFIYMLLGQAPAAFFEITAKRLPAYFARLAVAGITPYLPAISALLAEGDMPGASRLLNRTSNVFILVGYLGLFGTLVVQEPLVRLLFPEAYLTALPALGLVMASTCLAIQAGIMGQTLIALGRPGLVTAVNVASASISILANFALIPWLGIIGAGWAAICGTLVANVAQTWLVHRQGMRLNARHYIQGHIFAVLCAFPCWLMDGVSWRLIALGVYPVLFFLGGNITIREIWQALRPATGPISETRSQ